MRQCACMKTNSIGSQSLKAIAGTALGMAISTPVLTEAAEQVAWDKTFPKSEKVEHRKVTFKNRYGITLSADLYQPKHRVIEFARREYDLHEITPFAAFSMQI